MDMSITSDTKISDIEHHFRVSAGPGAGKTHWLTEHVKNVLHNSKRLGTTRKVACITYTNIAVETILKRLGTAVEQVEVSTLHSFLYKHVIKPYIHFIADKYEFNVSKLDGHDEIKVSRRRVVDWVENHPNAASFKHPYSVNQLTKLEDNKNALVGWLSSLFYEFDSTGQLIINSDRGRAFYFVNGQRRFLGRVCLDRLEPDLLGFKKSYWKRGILHHDDVLFFSHEIIKDYPFVLDILRAKFPYFFVDEFQDSNPIQVKILHQIGAEETIVGIIGDKAQSIYDFQGADPSQFHSFNLSGIKDYSMKDNRRSTNEIVDLLNHIRGDFQQNKYRNKTGQKPTLLVGNPIDALNEIKKTCDEKSIYSLSRKNITSNAMKKELDGINLRDTLFRELRDADSNSQRNRLMSSCINAIELAREKKFKEALKELKIRFGKDDDGKRKSLAVLSLLLEKYQDYKDKTLMYFYNILKTKIDTSLSGFRAGKAKTFYDGKNYNELALCVTIPEDLSNHKTIHKAKGDEFDNVLLVLEDERELSFVLNPDLGKPEHRVKYVGISRPKEKLFFVVPTLSESKKNQLTDKIEVKELSNSET